MIMEPADIRFNFSQIDEDLIQSLAETIGSIAVRTFEDPAVQEQFMEWKKKREDIKHD